MSRRNPNRGEVRTVRQQVLLSPNTRKALETLAQRRGSSLSDTINALIEMAAEELVNGTQRG